MNMSSTICYKMQMDSMPSPFSYTIVETGTGALFCEEDSIPLDLFEASYKIKSWRLK